VVEGSPLAVPENWDLALIRADQPVSDSLGCVRSGVTHSRRSCRTCCCLAHRVRRPERKPRSASSSPSFVAPLFPWALCGPSYVVLVQTSRLLSFVAPRSRRHGWVQTSHRSMPWTVDHLLARGNELRRISARSEQRGDQLRSTSTGVLWTQTRSVATGRREMGQHETGRFLHR
jgi:hypothetical protein